MKRIFFLILTALSLPFICQITVEEIGVSGDQIEKASDLFRSYKFEKVVDTLTPLILNFQNQEKEGRLQESDEHIFKKALELRAISYFNLGKESLSREDFTALIKLDSNYILESTSSTKIARFFNSLRESLCGVLNLDISPQESIVTIDGKDFTSKPSVYLLEGIHILKVEMMGFDSFSKEINITSGTTTNQSVKLKPNSRKVYFFIKPQGAKLFINGKFSGSADSKASTKTEWAEYVSANGFNPSDFFVVESLYLPPGTHKIEITSPCHSSRIFSLPISLDLENNKPGYIKPIELLKETLTLTIASYPSNASVEIDGGKAGKTPLKLENFCAGEHYFVISKENQGEFRKKIEFKGISEFTLEAKLRPTLLWIGTAYDQEIPRDTIALLSDSLKKGLSSLEAFNITFSEEANPLLPDLFYTKGVSEKEKNRNVSELCKKYGCEGALVAKCALEGEKQIVSLRLYIPDIEGCDETTSLLIDATDANFILKKFDKKENEKTLGLKVYFNETSKTVFVSDCIDFNSKLKIGDKILSVNGKSVSSLDDFYSIVNESDKSVKISVQRGPNTFDCELRKMDLIKIMPEQEEFSRRNFLLSRQQAISSETAAEKNIADINLSISELSLGRSEKALSILEKISLESEIDFLSPTVQYLKGIALLRLNREREAIEIFDKIKENSYRQTYLGNDSKIYLLPLVEDLLNGMQH